jgi:TusA-related sulfurtransferase
MTWVKTKLELDRMVTGETLLVTVADGEALENVPRSARAAGHDVSVDGTTIRIVRGEASPYGLVSRERLSYE